jgi:formate dehydrogenase major subunit
VLFLQGSLSHHGRLMPKLAREARATLHPDEAARLGIGEGEPLELAGPGGQITLPVAINSSVPAGSVFVAYAYASVELNRLGLLGNAPLRVKARRAPAMATV